MVLMDLLVGFELENYNENIQHFAFSDDFEHFNKHYYHHQTLQNMESKFQEKFRL